jgi:hypothetical protein
LNLVSHTPSTLETTYRIKLHTQTETGPRIIFLQGFNLTTHSNTS